MLTFPQLSTGASAQYPFTKRRVERRITNLTEDGQVISLSDSSTRTVTWELPYQELTDQEVLAVNSFFVLCEGSLQSFLFLDPSQNLLSYSEDYAQPAWSYSSFLNLKTGVGDPFDTSRASTLNNSTQAALQLTQTVNIPGTIQCAFSAYLRQGSPVNATSPVLLTRTDGSTIQRESVQLTSSWQRASVTSVFTSSESTKCDFSLTIPSGSLVDLFGLQVDAQPSPGKYVVSTSETGVYPNCRFDTKEIAVTATGPGQSSVKLSITSRTLL